MADFFEQSLVRTVAIIVAPIFSAALTLVFKPVRNFVFYTRAEYDLFAERKPKESPFKRSWSINWEDNKLKFEAGNISSDHIADTVFKDAFGKEHPEKRMHPKDDFTDIFGGALGVKINSIIRQDRPSDDDGSVYTLRLVIRRKRWK